MKKVILILVFIIMALSATAQTDTLPLPVAATNFIMDTDNQKATSKKLITKHCTRPTDIG